MKVEINDEALDEIVALHLTNILEDMYTSIETTMDGDVIGSYSFNIDTELFKLIEEYKSFEQVIAHFGGKPKSIDTLLKERDNEVYQHVQELKAVKAEKEDWVARCLSSEEELSTLQENIDRLLKGNK